MFGRPPTNFGPPGPFPGPGRFSPFMTQPPKTGGFLSRLFGGAARPGIGGFGGVPSSNLLGMANPAGQGGGFLGTMQNIEKMVQLAQTVRPMIQQYGPMVKNIPSMLELLKEYRNYSADNEQSNKDNKTAKNNKKETPTKKPARSKKETEDTIPVVENNTETITEKASSRTNSKPQPAKGLKIVPKKESLNDKKPQRVVYKASQPKLYI